MRTHRIAAIGGDGIGPEVIAAGLAGARRLRRARRRLPVRGRAFRLGIGLLQEARRHDAGRRRRSPAPVRRDLFRRRRRARHPRPHHAVGPAARDLPAARPIRQRAPDPHPARHHEPAAATSPGPSSTGSSCARTRRANMRASAAVSTRACRKRWRPTSRCSRAPAWRASSASPSSWRARVRASSSRS